MLKLYLLVLFIGNCLGQTVEQKVVSKFLPRNCIRWPTFVHVLRLAHERKLKRIVETGCMRSNFASCLGDGCSTAIFAEWVQANPGSSLNSVDIDSGNVANARNLLQVYSNVTIHNANSLDYLKPKASPPPENDMIDLLYLDSFDFQSSNPMPSQMHHLKEIQIAYPRLHRNSIVIADDCTLPYGGKCRLIDEFLRLNGWALDFQSYQKIWIATDKTVLKTSRLFTLTPNNELEGAEESGESEVREPPIDAVIRSVCQFRNQCQARPVTQSIEAIVRRGTTSTEIVEVLERPVGKKVVESRILFKGFQQNSRLVHLNAESVYYDSILWEDYKKGGIHLVYFHPISQSNSNDEYEALLSLHPHLAPDAVLVFDFCSEDSVDGEKTALAELQYDIHYFLRQHGFILLERSLDHQIWLASL